jgi:hypothetical protein
MIALSKVWELRESVLRTLTNLNVRLERTGRQNLPYAPCTPLGPAFPHYNITLTVIKLFGTNFYACIMWTQHQPIELNASQQLDEDE